MWFMNAAFKTQPQNDFGANSQKLSIQGSLRHNGWHQTPQQRSDELIAELTPLSALKRVNAKCECLLHCNRPYRMISSCHLDELHRRHSSKLTTRFDHRQIFHRISVRLDIHKFEYHVQGNHHKNRDTNYLPYALKAELLLQERHGK